LQLRLDSIVADRLALVCKSFLEQSLNNSDPSVWRVRDLTLNCYLDAGFSDVHSVARDWGRSIASEILSIIENGDVSDSILRFANRAAFLAQFLCDLASGRAWGKWYYEEFSDLQVLSVRQAICSIFLRSDTPPVDLLLQIASIGRLEDVLRVLSDNDAQLIFGLCFDSAAFASRSDNLQKWAGIVLELWNSAPLRAGSRAENRFQDALRLLVRALSRYPGGRRDRELQTVIHNANMNMLKSFTQQRVFDDMITLYTMDPSDKCEPHTTIGRLGTLWFGEVRDPVFDCEHVRHAATSIKI